MVLVPLRPNRAGAFWGRFLIHSGIIPAFPFYGQRRILLRAGAPAEPPNFNRKAQLLLRVSTSIFDFSIFSFSHF
jgi:hypothetical protein